jgi:hypothetical protein
VDDKRYFLATGAAEEAILRFEEEERAAQAAWRALVIDVGAKSASSDGSFDLHDGAPVPSCLKRYKTPRPGRGAYYPASNKAGKDLSARIEALPPLDSRMSRRRWRVNATLRGRTDGALSDAIQNLGIQRFGSKLVVTSYASWDPLIPECVPMKASEYWALHEAAYPAPRSEDL